MRPGRSRQAARRWLRRSRHSADHADRVLVQLHQSRGRCTRRGPRLKLGGMVKRSLATILVFALAILLVGETGIGATPETSTIQFRDVTQQAGIRFVHNNGAFGKKLLPETMRSEEHTSELQSPMYL